MRYIFYAKNLNESGTMSSYGDTTAVYSYIQNGIKVGIIGKNGSKWQIKLTNNTGSACRFYYNKKMCFQGDAQNWAGLSDITQTEMIENNSSTIIEIQENGTASSIAISYISDNTRYIFYAYELNATGKMKSFANIKACYSYTQNGMKISIVGKNGGTWLLELTNNTGSGRTFEYNRKMCFEGDAKNWTGLSDVAGVYLANGATTQIKIEENGTATSIAISYQIGIDRYIFYANNLDTKGTMTSYSNKKPTYYTENGIEVAIVSKSDKTWKLQIKNKTGSTQTFEYNSKMCFEGDAKNWKGLSDITSFSLANGSTRQISISENGTATSIAISYMDGTDRKVFYAKNLDASAGTMTAYRNTIDTTEPSGGCIAEGTMITLADGSQKAVEALTGEELLLVWNMETGTYDSAPILFIDSEPIGHYEVIELVFSDDMTVDVISEHGFWDVDLNKYVYLDENAAEYIGHSFLRQDGNGMAEVRLTGVEISTEVTTAYSPVTYGHLCYYVNGMLSMPGGIDGLFNIFEVNAETMTYDEESMAEDIEQYGLFTYEELNELVPVTEEMFEAVNGQYLKVAIGKGVLTVEQLQQLVNKYAYLFG